MLTRTDQEVENLWPKHDTYQIVAQVHVPNADNEQKADQFIQSLYSMVGGVAGGFFVQQHTDLETFNVQFIRDTPDDMDVLQRRLKKGYDFNQSLQKQLIDEIKDANRELGLDIRIKHVEQPQFPHVKQE